LNYCVATNILWHWSQWVEFWWSSCSKFSWTGQSLHVEWGYEKQHSQLIIVQMLCIVQTDAVTQDVVSHAPLQSHMDISHCQIKCVGVVRCQMNCYRLEKQTHFAICNVIRNENVLLTYYKTSIINIFPSQTANCS